MGSETGLPGVTALDHTADVGIELEAPTLEELFLRAAAGMMWLLRGEDGPAEVRGAHGDGAEPPGGDGSADPSAEHAVVEREAGEAGREGAERVLSQEGASVAPVETRALSATADDLPALLREWLRELLFWYEVEGLAFEGARFEELYETGLRAEVTVVADPEEPIREIKGVTLHGLLAEPRGDRWVGRVIFDV
jgi:SHS2 domain-containing protein